MAVPKEPFFDFHLMKFSLYLHMTYAVCKHRYGLEVTGVQGDAAICEKVLQTKQLEDFKVKEENSLVHLMWHCQKIRKPALNKILQLLQYKGADMDKFFHLKNDIKNRIKPSVMLLGFIENRHFHNILVIL